MGLGLECLLAAAAEKRADLPTGSALSVLAAAGQGQLTGEGAMDDKGRPLFGPDGQPLEYASSCFLPTTWVPCPLVSQTEYSHDSKVYTFGLPEGRSLNLPVCSCILVQGPEPDVVRPYTPISSAKEVGTFRLLIKRYPGGKVSQMIDGLSPGQTANFKHIKVNIKEQHPFRRKKLSMICGGTGITPIYQALQRIVETPEHQYDVVVLDGNRTEADILLRKELDEFVAKTEGRIKIVHVIGTSKQGEEVPADWKGEKGWVDEEKVKKHCFPPGDDTLIMVCGVPPLYDIFCGPRTEKELKEGTVLHKLGYTTEMVVKF
eukprot:TRINITY_DN14187_c0_g1_i1.p1 TRINITY_DN14187_c0_g1~~TRINITY_DN14187_c0_g1_i1.p1  ORF type:complete len:341 (+),score=129.50 TRINITY_DN14187_c0_g1_i1:70-1023(+)